MELYARIIENAIKPVYGYTKIDIKIYPEYDIFCTLICISKMRFRKFTPLEKRTDIYAKIFFFFLELLF